MTSFAFILGVSPLVIAGGAGAASRHSLDTSVFFGMSGATALGVFFIPMFCETIRAAVTRRRGQAGAGADGAASDGVAPGSPAPGGEPRARGGRAAGPYPGRRGAGVSRARGGGRRPAPEHAAVTLDTGRMALALVGRPDRIAPLNLARSNRVAAV